MPTKRMLIDASHPEETRVAIVSGHHLEDFDVEVEARRQLRGNIYLAKVTRVEPSLQAAFVDYGGNRHGFLAFSEIHPDYYQIPVADREALLAEEVAEGTKAEALEGAELSDEANAENDDGPGVETLGGDDSEEVEARRPASLRRKYKIQEVIKRRQILLIQVVKEERGTKGAALTTYLSLAGRYCVLMPNTARGGGISRKIASSADRKQLKNILNGLSIPAGVAVIVRTAGQKRSKTEIKRDYEYLMRVWSTVRSTTLESMAPCLVHEEGNLIKRSLRDLYDKDIDEIIIDGDEGYRTAKDFMKVLIPSHTKRVQPYKEVGKQLFQYYDVESQLDGMHSPNVQLKSGGYVVINPTEALVSIDVNSGRATRGRNIEETAFKTNIEAADEIARQLKLRDLAGLIVIDYIDMEVKRNQVKVEHRLKDAMRNDRARIQIGRISPFGLLELSRQRLRPSLIETSSDPCPHCEGTGIRRSTDSAALHLLRAIEDEGMQKRSKAITVFVPTAVAIYILNNQRAAIAEIENKYQLAISLETDDSLIPPDYRMELDKTGQQSKDAKTGKDSDSAGRGDGNKRRRRRRSRPHQGEESGDVTADAIEPSKSKIAGDAGEGKSSSTSSTTTTTGGDGGDDDGANDKPKRRRRGRRGGRRRGRKPIDQQAGDKVATTGPVESPTSGAGADNVILLGGPDQPAPETVQGTDNVAQDMGQTEKKNKTSRRRAPKAKKTETVPASAEAAPVKDAVKPVKKNRSRKPKVTKPASASDAPKSQDSKTTKIKDDAKSATKKPARKPRQAAKSKEPVAVIAASSEGDLAKPEAIITSDAAVTPGGDKADKPGKKGWWRRG
ncbi:MAG: Rne/Rng family ribonuclease [Rhodospirillales bacterium]